MYRHGFDILFEAMQVDCAGNPLSVSAAAELTLEPIIGSPQFPPRPVFGTKKQTMVRYILVKICDKNKYIRYKVIMYKNLESAVKGPEEDSREGKLCATVKDLIPLTS